ncbi:rhomboid family intramembrane serine protease [Mycobacterium sp. CVI_P3]|uniref:Rhomboid family intramembrane serine protease n=1 Tax=Mycobacterium pinniadriaticum TaxID=2994102 RepID=A0ABT3S8C1_9MYCO|nr:rhomboid family intramembrane serine protease [Mycobacterium pinniadriaticum]MCX2929197.1 rhomboid family intramembrane serine protease [Mycobacterium pinniadriaticum]MCX2935622.1 rhomboid family intramembrane serine protease [Mycobacterium pinniadriaticum]
MSNPYTPQTPAGTPTCYRHPDRPTYVRCTRCQRPVCGDCMRSAAVGHQCVDCVAQGAKSVRPVRTGAGGVLRSGRPLVTYTLIAINVVMFVAQMTSRDLQRQLVLWAPGVAGGEYFRLVTSAFMHYGVVHLLFNMWALYVIGPPLEAWLGRLRFGALYGLSALGGSVLVYLLAPIGAATAGASGAIFGLFGATFVVAKRLSLDMRWLIAIIVANLILTFTVPSISWQGHIGGLVTGAGIAALFAYAPRDRRNLVQGGVCAALLVLFGALIYWRTAELIGQYGALITG